MPTLEPIEKKELRKPTLTHRRDAADGQANFIISILYRRCDISILRRHRRRRLSFHNERDSMEA